MSTQDLDLDALSRKLMERSQRFNELVNTFLSHPLMPFCITRLHHALLAVALSSDEAWAAFERHCADRDRQDREQAV